MFRTSFVGTILIAAGIVAACQEPDPNYGDPSGIIGKKLPGEVPLTSGGTTSSSGDGAASSSGSSVPTATAPTISVADEHADGGGPAVPFSTDCMTCHAGSGPAKTTFAFGGLLSNANGQTVTVAVDNLAPVATDDAGYFWSTSTTAIAQGASVAFYPPGATAQKGAMPGLPAGTTGGACLAGGTCHGGSEGPITLNQ